MNTILATLQQHDPSVVVLAADVTTAYAADIVGATTKAKPHLLYAQQALLAYLSTDEEFYLGLARVELLKAGWAP